MPDHDTLQAQDTPVAITAEAVAELKRLLGEQDSPAPYLRIAAFPGGCSGLQYQLAWENNRVDADQLYQYDSVQVLIDNKTLPHISGATLDFERSERGSGFTFMNPNARGGCGCGSGSCGA